MWKKKSLCCLLLLLLCVSVEASAAKQPPPEILGVRLGMTKEEVRSRLEQIAERRKEDREGKKQQVWIVRDDPRIDYLMVRFNPQQQLVYMTAVVRRNARMRYRDLADLKDAQRATDGSNYAYTWKVAAESTQPAYAVVARGSNAKYLNAFSIYKLVAGR